MGETGCAGCVGCVGCVASLACLACADCADGFEDVVLDINLFRNLLMADMIYIYIYINYYEQL
tara:strand:- start:732 stop:920 length:189 start_codon:yes stop_codon:yes gene_type:complete